MTIATAYTRVSSAIAFLLVGSMAYAQSSESRFQAYNDGTVKDNQTGLTWADQDNGNDIEFSLMFKDDNEDEANMLVEPVRVTDREGQLDIDTTGVCEIIWSNAYAWLTSKTISYQLQLAPKIDLLKKK